MAQYTMLTEPVGSTVTVVGGSSASSSGKSGGSKAGIAAGAVVGIIAIAAIIGGAWFYLRARKRRAVEEEYRRNATINSFIQKPGSTSSISDSRLEPSVMMQRRMSDGSIADNQDYSRRILKVLAMWTRLILDITDNLATGHQPRW